MKHIYSSLIAMICIAINLSFVSAWATGPEKKEEMGASAKALFAGGCFWCMTKPFVLLDGVASVSSGYAGGTTQHPTYQNYVGGDHIEVVQIHYDPNKITYGKLLDTFWRQIDPTDAGGQFVDRGHAYISAIFTYNDEQRRVAEA